MGVRRAAVSYVNDLRVKRGLDPLDVDPRLNKPTRRHSRYMARTGDFSHSSSDAITRQMNSRVGAGNWDLAGENIGKAGTSGLTGLLAAFKASDDHRHNMLRPRYDNISVGVARNPQGQLYLTYWFYG